MRFNRSPLRAGLSVIFMIFAWTAMAAAQTPQQHQQELLSNVHVKNFGQMDERFYRGAQPKKDDYKDLAALGIKTVIDLRADPTDYEKREVEALGMHYVNIPMVDKQYPTDEAVATFLKVVDDPATGKFFVHCAGGRHRTGAMGAVYRYNKYDWNFEQVYAEMKQYDFYTRFGHGDFKKFVQDYWEQHRASAAHHAAVAVAPSK